MKRAARKKPVTKKPVTLAPSYYFLVYAGGEREGEAERPIVYKDIEGVKSFLKIAQSDYVVYRAVVVNVTRCEYKVTLDCAE